MPPQTSNQTSSLEEARPLVSTAAVVPHRHAHLRSAVSAPGDRPPSQQEDNDDDCHSSAPPPLPASDGGGAIPYSTPSSTPSAAEAQGAGLVPIGTTRSDLGAEHQQRDSTSGGDGTAAAALPASSFGGATGREWSLTPGPGAMIAAAAGGGSSLTTALEAMEEDAAVAAATVEGEDDEVAKERTSQPNDVTVASEDGSAAAPVAESVAPPPPVRKSTEVLGGPTWSITPGPGALIPAGRWGDNVWVGRGSRGSDLVHHSGTGGARHRG